MDLTMMQKKKHLLLLNRIMRAELKKDIIPTPSKLTEEEVNQYFNKLFVKKDDYYVPIKTKAELKIDEEQFKELIKKPRTLAQRTEEKKKEKEVQSEKDKEMAISITFSVYKKFEKDFVEPYVKKKRANEDFKKEEEMMIKKYIKLGAPVKELISKKLPKMWEALLNPSYLKRVDGKEGLVEKDKKLMKSELNQTPIKEEKKPELNKLTKEEEIKITNEIKSINTEANNISFSKKAKNIMNYYKYDQFKKQIEDIFIEASTNLIKDNIKLIKSNKEEIYNFNQSIKNYNTQIEYYKNLKTKQARDKNKEKIVSDELQINKLKDEIKFYENKDKIINDEINTIKSLKFDKEEDFKKFLSIKAISNPLFRFDN